MPRTVIWMLIAALLFPWPSGANPAAVEMPSLSAALQDALNQPGNPSLPRIARCEKSFREYLDVASGVVDELAPKTHPAVFSVLWVVAEDGRGSSINVIQPSHSGKWRVNFRSEDFSDDTELSPGNAKRFKTAWQQVMTGDITEVKDVADGSCVLVYDGKHARLFLPEYGVMASGADALQAILNLLDAKYQPDAAQTP